MCCRYLLEESPELRPIVEAMNRSPLSGRIFPPEALRSSGEIRPSDVSPVIAPDRAGRRTVFPMRWGFREKSLVINTSDLVVGVPAEGYHIRRISAEPATLNAAGRDPLISSLNELHLAEYTDQQIDVTGLDTTITRNVSLNKTGDIVHYSADTVMVTVEIGPQKTP